MRSTRPAHLACSSGAGRQAPLGWGRMQPRQQRQPAALSRGAGTSWSSGPRAVRWCHRCRPATGGGRLQQAPQPGAGAHSGKTAWSRALMKVICSSCLNPGMFCSLSTSTRAWTAPTGIASAQHHLGLPAPGLCMAGGRRTGRPACDAAIAWARHLAARQAAEGRHAPSGWGSQKRVSAMKAAQMRPLRSWRSHARCLRGRRAPRQCRQASLRQPARHCAPASWRAPHPQAHPAWRAARSRAPQIGPDDGVRVGRGLRVPGAQVVVLHAGAGHLLRLPCPARARRACFARLVQPAHQRVVLPEAGQQRALEPTAWHGMSFPQVQEPSTCGARTPGSPLEGDKGGGADLALLGRGLLLDLPPQLVQAHDLPLQRVHLDRLLAKLLAAPLAVPQPDDARLRSTAPLTRPWLCSAVWGRPAGARRVRRGAHSLQLVAAPGAAPGCAITARV